MSMGTQILIRTRVSPLTLVNAIRKQVSAVNSDQQVYGDMADLEKWLSDEPEWQQEHLVSWIFGGFAGLALLLAAVGIFSVVSYAVAQRTNEFGIRMAMGAPRGHVLGIVYVSTMASMPAGILTGIALIYALNRFVAKWVVDNSHDPAILLGGTLILVATIACILPALRASRVDPITALRCE
jgi:ABC-type antimicrobial peptide transport system permease subunit